MTIVGQPYGKERDTVIKELETKCQQAIHLTNSILIPSWLPMLSL